MRLQGLLPWVSVGEESRKEGWAEVRGGVGWWEGGGDREVGGGGVNHMESCKCKFVKVTSLGWGGGGGEKLK